MTFPAQVPGVHYLTEGGSETEIMYRHGFDLPEFAMFPLLDNPEAFTQMRGMWEAYLDTAVKHEMGVVIGGLDYRASPDWAGLLGYSNEALAEMQLRSIEFLREIAKPYEAKLPSIYFAGVIGPRGDAYTVNETITADEAEEYHGEQLRNLASVGVDLVEAMTFSGVPESVGIARAAAKVDLTLCVSYIVDYETGRLSSGPSVKEAIEAVDELAGDARPAFYGINCAHPLEFMPAIEPGDWFQRVRCLRPNAVAADKIALCTLGHLEEGDPVALGALMGELARKHPHIDMWGGCCGTWDKHLDQIATNVLAAHAL